MKTWPIFGLVLAALSIGIAGCGDDESKQSCTNYCTQVISHSATGSYWCETPDTLNLVACDTWVVVPEGTFSSALPPPPPDGDGEEEADAEGLETEEENEDGEGMEIPVIDGDEEEADGEAPSATVRFECRSLIGTPTGTGVRIDNPDQGACLDECMAYTGGDAISSGYLKDLSQAVGRDEFLQAQLRRRCEGGGY